MRALHSPSWLLGFLLAVSSFAPGCALEEDLRIGSTSQAATAENGLQLNGLQFNGLQLNGLQFNGLQLNGLQLNGLQLNGLQFNGLQLNGTQIESFKEVLRYLVECALEATQSIVIEDENGVPYTLNGSLGVAPMWATGPLDTDGEEAVSSCLYARANALGVNVTISLRGKWPGLATSGAEGIEYMYKEGAFFGNVWATDPAEGIAYACWFSDEECLALYDRLCAYDDTCGFEIIGHCYDFCEPNKKKTETHLLSCNAGGRTWYNVVKTKLPDFGSLGDGSRTPNTCTGEGTGSGGSSCGDGVCDSGEDCSCQDCACAAGEACDAGICVADSCAAQGTACTSGAECCSGQCHRGSGTCR